MRLFDVLTSQGTRLRRKVRVAVGRKFKPKITPEQRQKNLDARQKELDAKYHTWREKIAQSGTVELIKFPTAVEWKTNLDGNDLAHQVIQFNKKITSRSGRPFQIAQARDGYESNLALAIFTGNSSKILEDKIASISIGFDKTHNALIIEAMQTHANEAREYKKYLNEFHRTTKRQAIDYLLTQMEELSKLNGYREIRIRRPETLYYYHRPASKTGQAYGAEIDIIRTQMRKLYDTIAQKHGYKKEEYYYTKKL
jgi:hypothetical protein